MMDNKHQARNDNETTLLTERLRLRPPGVEDARLIFNTYTSDPEVTRYLAWPAHRELADTLGFLQFSQSQWQRWQCGPYLIEARDTGELLGSTGLDLETEYRASTGYVLARKAWGEGYATEALNAMVSKAQGMGIQRLYALCHTDHRLSSRVLEKCGFAFEGILHRQMLFPNLGTPHPEDVDCYARIFEA